MNTPSTHPSSAGSLKQTGASSSAPAAGSVQKRLQSELMQLMMSGNKDISAFPEADNMFEWAATVKGPAGSPYEGMTFKLKLKFPADYPFTAPTVTFVTPVYHPNVDNFGNICLDVLKEKWTAAYSVSTVLLSLQALLQDANVASPLNGPAATLWADQKAFRATAVKRYNEATDAESHIVKASKRPSTASEFVGRAVLCLALQYAGVEESSVDIDFLCAMADMAAAIYDDKDGSEMWAAVCAASRQVGAVAQIGAGAPSARSATGAVPHTPSFSTHAKAVRFEVIVLVPDCGSPARRIAVQERGFIYEALQSARRELLASANDLPEQDGPEFDNAVEFLRYQCELGRKAAAGLGFTDMCW